MFNSATTPVRPDDSKKVDFQERYDQLNKQIDDYDRQMLSYIGRLYEAVNGEKLDFDKVKNAVDALKEFDAKEQYNYLDNLLHPEKRKGVKIPSSVPVPSNAFQLHNCVTLTTNSSGNLVGVFNPDFLYNKDDPLDWKSIPTGSNHFISNYLSTLAVYSNDDLNGTNIINRSGTRWNYINIGQGIPNVYSQYRLVSASLVIKYIGRMDISSGVMGGAIIFDENKEVMGMCRDMTTGTNNLKMISTQLDKYTNFDIAMDSFYHQENLCIEGLRQLYFPVDNSYEEYVKTFDNQCVDKITQSGAMPDGRDYFIPLANADYYKSGFNFMFYVLGAPPSSACFKLDIYCNYECLPNPEFLNYMPISSGPMCISQYEKRQAIQVVQEKPVMKLNEETIMSAGKPDIWQKLKKKFSDSLPGIKNLIRDGVVSMYPALKPMMGILGSFVSGGMNID